MGRLALAKYGIPYAGAQDLMAYRWVNHLLQNEPDAAVLEIGQPGLKARFESSARICLAGAASRITLDDKNIPAVGILDIPAGKTLCVHEFIKDSYLYVGIRFGFQTTIRLGSRSYTRGITKNEFVRSGEQIPYIPIQDISPLTTQSRAVWKNEQEDSRILRAYQGPEFSKLSKAEQRQLFQRNFTISTMKNGMGVQLAELFPSALEEIYTAPVFPGTVQLTPGGKLICLLQDAQVTGGYPRVLQIAQEDIRKLAQRKVGAKIQFCLKNL